MLAVVVIPVQTCVRYEDILLREERHHHGGHSTEVTDFEGRNTHEWAIVALAIAVIAVADILCQFQALVDVECRHQTNIEDGVFSLVLVVAVGIVENGNRVGKRVAATQLTIDVVVIAEERSIFPLNGAILIRANDWSLDEREESR